MRYGIADYGMNVWDGALWDLEERLLGLKKIGYEGLERIAAGTEAELVRRAALHRRLGMGFATVAGPTPEVSIQWAAAMGCAYVWVAAKASDMAGFCRQANAQARAAERWGVKVALHNHMGTRVESQTELETFLRRCPKVGIILDTAHLAAVDGDPVEIVRKYHKRIVVMHLKDWLVYPAKKQGKRWHEKGRFCGLGKGNIGLDNVAVMKALRKAKWDGWVFVEHDTHLRDPFKDLALSRTYLKRGGF
jgi:sugar phosphate isomerase/epimerase